MKNSMRYFICGTLALGVIAAFIMTAPAAATTQKVVSQKTVPQPTPLPRFCVGPDLVANPPALEKKVYQNAGYVPIRCDIVNQGKIDFVARAGQAVAILMERRLWNTGGVNQIEISRASITKLRVGEHLTFGVTDVPNSFRSFDCAAPLKPGECCREKSFFVMIVYDPDIRQDGNTANDDCVAGNNVSPDLPSTHFKWVQGNCPH
jgi:hypothetical protein